MSKKFCGAGGGSEKNIYPQTPLCGVFWYSPYSALEAGSALHVLHQAIKIRVTWLDLVQIYFTVTGQKNQYKLADVPYFSEFYKLGETLLLNVENAS